jgi:nitrate reductase NapAB chaperone NapD
MQGSDFDFEGKNVKIVLSLPNVISVAVRYRQQPENPINYICTKFENSPGFLIIP